MADETTNIHDITSNFDRTSRQLESLAQTEGAAGAAQRAMKGNYQNAYNYQAATDYSGNVLAEKDKAASNGFNRFAAAPARPAARGQGGYGAGGLDGRARVAGGGGLASPASSTQAAEAAKAAGELSYGGEIQKEAENVKGLGPRVGNRTF